MKKNIFRMLIAFVLTGTALSGCASWHHGGSRHDGGHGGYDHHNDHR